MVAKKKPAATPKKTTAKGRPSSRRPPVRPHTLSIGYKATAKADAYWSPDSPAGRLIEAVGKGAPQSSACAYAGIVPRTLQHWRTALNALDADDEHQGDDLRLVRFFRLFDEAAAALTVELVGSWADAAKSDWRAAQAFLARRDPTEWGDPAKRVELSGPDGAPVAVTSPVAAIVAAASARAIAEAE